MTTLLITKPRKLLNLKGETLVELLISIFILTLLLTLVISAFMSGRSGIVESWKQSNKNECAANVLEQIKSLKYDTLVSWQDENINYDVVFPTEEKLECAAFYEVQFDLLPYESYSIKEIMEVIVQVRHDENDKWVEFGSLKRKGVESP